MSEVRRGGFFGLSSWGLVLMIVVDWFALLMVWFRFERGGFGFNYCWDVVMMKCWCCFVKSQFQYCTC